MEEIREILAKNLTRLRNEHGLTQTELAKKINYTDKSVSKWENGDSMPPVDVLKELADLYGVSLDYLVSDVPPESWDKFYTAKENRPNKMFITLLSVSIVWIVVTILFVYSSFFEFMKSWMLFVMAVPVSVLVLMIFNFIWGKRKFSFVLISLLNWTILATVYLWFLEYNPWIIFIIGIPIQLATILWSQLKFSKKN